MTHEEALQIAKKELDDKIERLKTFKGHSSEVGSYIYNLSMRAQLKNHELAIKELEKLAEKELEKLAEEPSLDQRIEELECEVDVIRTQVENIIYMCESNHEREAIINYAKHMLTDINSVLEVEK